MQMAENATGYTAAQVRELVEAAGISMSTFYRLTRNGEIEKYLPEGRTQDATYNRIQVDNLVKRGAVGRGRKGTYVTVNHDKGYILQEIQQKSAENEEEVATDWIQKADLPYVYVLDTELYGVESSVSPTITWTWWQKNPNACRILFNKNNRKEIWGALTIIPMHEDIIIKLLSGDLKEQEITSDQVLTYEHGKQYIGYIASIAIRPEHKKHFGRLLHGVLDYWCQQYPDIKINKLYAFALGSEDGEESDGLRLIRKLYFAPRYDIGDGKNAYELRLDHYNPSQTIRNFQNCLQERLSIQKRSIGGLVLSDELLSSSAIGEQGEEAGTRFERAEKQDIIECVEIDQEIFGPSSVTPFDEQVATRQQWWEKNNEIFHVLRKKGQIVGYFSMVPLPREKIVRILREEEHPRDIAPRDIELFQPGKPLDIYIVVMGVRPTFTRQQKRFLGGQLLKGMTDLFREWGNRGVTIRAVYARSRMEEAIKLLEHIGFKELDFSPFNGKRLFQLDIEISDEPFTRECKQALLAADND